MADNACSSCSSAGSCSSDSCEGCPSSKQPQSFQEKLNEYLLTVYQLVDEEQDLFMRTDELHSQRAYETEVIKECLAAQGFYEIQVYEAMTKEEPTKQSERVYFTARKK